MTYRGKYPTLIVTTNKLDRNHLTAETRDGKIFTIDMRKTPDANF